MGDGGGAGMRAGLGVGGVEGYRGVGVGVESLDPLGDGRTRLGRTLS